jgi:hypothetical protein
MKENLEMSSGCSTFARLAKVGRKTFKVAELERKRISFVEENDCHLTLEGTLEGRMRCWR